MDKETRVRVFTLIGMGVVTWCGYKLIKYGIYTICSTIFDAGELITKPTIINEQDRHEGSGK